MGAETGSFKQWCIDYGQMAHWFFDYGTRLWLAAQLSGWSAWNLQADRHLWSDAWSGDLYPVGLSEYSMSLDNVAAVITEQKLNNENSDGKIFSVVYMRLPVSDISYIQAFKACWRHQWVVIAKLPSIKLIQSSWKFYEHTPSAWI